MRPAREHPWHGARGGGYLDAQRKGLLGERHATRTRELSRLHGYDTKYAMHALRIGHQGVELLTTGRVTLPMPERSDVDAVDRFVVRAYRATWDAGPS